MKLLFSLSRVVLGASLASATTLRTLDVRAFGSAVNTTSGPVTGHAASNASAVVEYLGIPYAKPPVGDLRWAPPVRYEGTAGINGTNFGFSCPATTVIAAAGGSSSDFNIAGANLTSAGFVVLSQFGQLGDRFSEDCLTLNVWVPSGGEAKKAVLLWIYGGGFSTGSSDTTTYNGQNIAGQEDVIVVSINYRLNIFGFPGNPSVPDQNFGLLDQRLAIEWVRDNIPAFGGDASRITIFGQSAGSASVDYYSYAYASDPIVNGLIQESGTINGFGSNTAKNASASWFTVSATLGCNSTSNADDVLTCMRTKNFTSILTAVSSTGGTSSGTGSTAFYPTVDERTVFSDYLSRSVAKNFTRVPLLIGSADYEAGLFATIAALTNTTYPRAYWDQDDLSTFTCPAGVRANISLQAGVITWRYRWFGAFPNTRLTTVPDSGAWHASELPVLFDTLPTGSGIPASTAEEVSIGKYIRGAWATFAKDPVNGLKTYGGGWPTYNPSENTLIRLAFNNVTGTNLAMPSMYDVGCNVTYKLTGSANITANGTSTASGTSTSTASSTASASATGSSSDGIRITTFYGSVLSVVTILSSVYLFV